MPCPDCERLIGEDAVSRKLRGVLFDIENLAHGLGHYAIARMARRGRIGKVACDNEDAARLASEAALEIQGKEVIITS